MFWGHSEPLDLFEEYETNVGKPKDDLNIFLFGSCDPRHILKTISKSYKHQTKVNFYSFDICTEVIARNILLMMIALESPKEISIQNKTLLFMDIYGNSLNRTCSSYYISSKGTLLKKMISDPDLMNNIAPIFDIKNLKDNERDILQDIFNFWEDNENEKNYFDISTCWNKLVRHELGDRYDNRNEVYHWDFYFAIKSSKAAQVCLHEYKKWRETGIAFKYSKTDQVHPNKTLACGARKIRNSFTNAIYHGDIKCGPFSTFGLDNSLSTLKKYNDKETNNRLAADVTERNIYEMMFEIQEKTEYFREKKRCTKIWWYII